MTYGGGIDVVILPEASREKVRKFCFSSWEGGSISYVHVQGADPRSTSVTIPGNTQSVVSPSYSGAESDRIARKYGPGRLRPY